MSSTLSRRSTLGLIGGTIALTLGEFDADAARRKNRGRGKQQRKRKNRRNRQAACKATGRRACDIASVGPNARLTQCDLAQAGLVGASLQGAKLDRANLKGAHLLAADLEGGNLDRTCLAGASLRNANLRNANVARASFASADLCGADLRGSNVIQAQVADADVCCGTLLGDGTSAAPCRAGTACCGTGCVPLNSDPYNCGACGNTCAMGEICCNGQCDAPSNSGACSISGVQCLTPSDDLQTAISGAKAGDVLRLCQGTWHITETLLIDVDLQIVGGFDGGTSEIDAGNSCQVFGIRENAHVTMTNVAIHGGEDQDGAGIFNQGYLTLGDCNVNVNSAFGYGGGIYNEGTLRLVRGFVQDNTAYNEDFGYGGLGLYNDEGTVIIEGASVSYN